MNVKEGIGRLPRHWSHVCAGVRLDEVVVVVLVRTEIRPVTRTESIDDDRGERSLERGQCCIGFPLLVDRGLLADAAVAGNERGRVDVLIRLTSASGANPAKTTLWTAPRRAQASIAIGT